MYLPIKWIKVKCVLFLVPALLLVHGRTIDDPSGAFSLTGPVKEGEQDMYDGMAGSEQPAAGFLPSLLNAFLMIMVTELGDETFIVAALMAMRYSKVLVYAGAILALVTMTVISTALGMLVPTLAGKRTTGILAACLYTFFGARLFWIAYHASGQVESEIEEVEEKLADGSRDGRLRHILRSVCSAAFLQAFALTFLAEWGDRSQIATVSLAAHDNALGVAIGAIAGHMVCTGAAVTGGELLARRISMRAMAIAGGTLFWVFAIAQAVSALG